MVVVVVDCRLMVVGCWLLWLLVVELVLVEFVVVVDCCLMNVGCWLFVVGCWLLWF